VSPHAAAQRSGDLLACRPGQRDGTITYSANFASPFAFRRVFIQTGRRVLDTGNASPVCSDYLIENGQLLHYSGPGPTSPSRPSPCATITGTDTYSWTIPAATSAPPPVRWISSTRGYSPLSTPIGGGRHGVGHRALSADRRALSQYVQGAVQQAAVTPRPGPANSHQPALPIDADDTWHLGSTSGCMVGSFSVGSRWSVALPAPSRWDHRHGQRLPRHPFVERAGDARDATSVGTVPDYSSAWHRRARTAAAPPRPRSPRCFRVNQ